MQHGLRRVRHVGDDVVPAPGELRLGEQELRLLHAPDPNRSGARLARPLCAYLARVVELRRRYRVAFLARLRALPAACCVSPFSLCTSPFSSVLPLPAL